MAYKPDGENVREMIILFSIVLAFFLQAVEGVTLLQQKEGSVVSPGFPDGYPNGYHHVWEIRVPEEYRIKLEFLYFHLEGNCSGTCNCDSLTIYDGRGIISNSLIDKLCDKLLIPPIVSTTHIMSLEFKTDGSVSAVGFNITYTTELNLNAIVPIETEKNLAQYFLNTRKQTHNINKWGEGITRTAVALYLHDPLFFAANNKTGSEITYELTLQLMSKLVTKKRISTKDLALFVNAFTVTCINPKAFFGVNIVAELRKRVDNSHFKNPFFILSLCNAGENMTMEEVLKLQQLFDTHLRSSWTGTQAMVVMALKCISQKSKINLDNVLEEMTLKLQEKQQNNGTVENLKSTALVIQALLAPGKTDTNFLVKSVKTIIKEMEDRQLSTEEVYYFLPFLKRKTLLNINSIHCESFIETDFEEMKNLIRKQPDERIQIQISAIVGDEMDFTRTWRINIPSNYSIYQALENINSSDPHFKVKYTFLDGKPYIAGLVGYEYSIEGGLFWFIYTKRLSSNDDLTAVEESPIDIRVKETNEVILWYRSVLLPVAHETSTDASTTENMNVPSDEANNV